MQCKNCQTELSGKQHFCANCGQKNIPKLTMKYILSQFVEDVFNVDSKVFRTLRFLSLKPGYLTKEYIDGKRVSYVPPVRLYIVLSVFFFFMLSVINYGDGSIGSVSLGTPPPEAESAQVNTVSFTVDSQSVMIPADELKRMEYEGTIDEGLDSLTAEMPAFSSYIARKMAKASVKGEGFRDILTDQFSLFLLLFLPFFALQYATIFSGSKKGFIGHLIFNLHFNSFIMLSLIISLLIDAFTGDNVLKSMVIIGLTILIQQVYLIRAIMRFYNRGTLVALYKYVFLIFGYVVLALVFIIAVFASSILLV